MKPIAIDLGRPFWVMAKTDAEGIPEVANLGNAGQITAIISEYNGEVLFGQHLIDSNSLPPLIDFYRLLSPDFDTQKEFGERARIGNEGVLEVFIAQQWFSITDLLTQLLRSSMSQVKEHLSPNSALPVVVAIPPFLDEKVLTEIEKALVGSGLSLAAWCPTPIAALLDKLRSHPIETGYVFAAHLERGSMTFALIELKQGFPRIKFNSFLDWPFGEPLPADDARQLLKDFLEEVAKRFNLSIEQIAYLLVSGEKLWTSLFASLIKEQLPAKYLSLSQPHLSVAIGASLLAEEIQKGLIYAPLTKEETMEKIPFYGLTIPEARMEIVSSAQKIKGSANFMGEFFFELPEDEKDFDIYIKADDGRRFHHHLSFDEKANSSEMKLDMEKTTQLPGSFNSLLAPIGIQIGEKGSYFEMLPVYSPLPSEATRVIPVEELEADLWVVERPTTLDRQWALFGKVKLSELMPFLRPTAQVEVKLICNDKLFLEIHTRVLGNPKSELHHVFQRQECEWFTPQLRVEQGHEYQSDNSHKRKTGKKMKSSDGGESTRPDLEVPAELLDSAQPLEREPNSPTKNPPSPSGIPNVEEAELMQEDDEEFSFAPPYPPQRKNPSSHNIGIGQGAIGNFSAEGDGSTMVFSRAKLFSDEPKTTNSSISSSNQAPPNNFGQPTPPPSNSPSLPPRVSLDSHEEKTVIATSLLFSQSSDDNQENFSGPITPRNNPAERAAPALNEAEYLELAEEFTEIGGDDIVEIDESMFIEDDGSQDSEQSDFDRIKLSTAVNRDHTLKEVLAVSEDYLQNIQAEPPSTSHAPAQSSSSKGTTRQNASFDNFPSSSSSHEALNTVSDAADSSQTSEEPPLSSSKATFSSQSSRPTSSSSQASLSSGSYPQHPSSSQIAPSSSPLLDKIAQARQLASEARALLDEVSAITSQVDALEDQKELLKTLQLLDEHDEDVKSLETTERREIRKILDLARKLSDVEANRLPTSTRKTLTRLAKELDSHLMDDNARLPMRLALQLANRLFDIIRRDLRSW